MQIEQLNQRVEESSHRIEELEESLKVSNLVLRGIAGNVIERLPERDREALRELYEALEK